jgi:hypothetical protein
MAGALNSIPFLGGYMTMDAANRGREGQQFQQAQQFMTLQGAMEDRGAKRAALERENSFRTRLAGATTDEQRAQIAMEAEGPKGVLSHLDRQATVQAARDGRAATIDAARINSEAQRDQRTFELQEKGRQSLTEIAEKHRLGLISQAQAAEMARLTRLEVVHAIAANRAPPAPRTPIQQTAEDGTTTLWDHSGNLIKNLGRTGKPSVQYQKIEQQKKQLGMDLSRAIGELEKATVDGGLIDSATGSGAGALVDSAAGFFGKATPGAIASGQIAPIYDLVLKMVPRFEGPQSDKDTASYERASGQLANPAIPNAQKKEAAKEILRLMKDRKAQFVSKDMVEVPAAPAGPKFLGFE